MGTALFVRLSVCGSIYVYHCRALLVTGCMRLPMRITLHGGPEKWQKRGRAKQVLSRFCREEHNF